jgi:predicted nucleotidyltransferase component of viral defense system
MLTAKLEIILEKNQGRELRPDFRRTLLKEPIQDYILNFIYNNKVYNKLIFTGGTCLRKVYGLARLSEDLDFDYKEKFNIQNFAEELVAYFKSNIQYKRIEFKISNNEETVFIKFPKLLEEIGLVKTSADSSLLFVRCDFSKESLGKYFTEINPITAIDFTFFVLSYDRETMFANKIIAFLKRDFFRGKEQQIAFKGRDLFDLVWFFEQSSKTGYKLQPVWERVYKGLGVKTRSEVVDLLIDKLEKIKRKDIYNDLLPFFESANTIENFSENFKAIIANKAKSMIQY